MEFTKTTPSEDALKHAHSYTVMRIAFGMSGLAYSNDNNKPNLYVNKNCHSCSILGHKNLLNIHELYNVIIKEDNGNDNFPRLEIGDKIYEKIELNRKLFENINIKDISDEKLEKMCINDYKNYAHYDIK